jgi:hypothetical protein
MRAGAGWVAVAAVVVACGGEKREPGAPAVIENTPPPAQAAPAEPRGPTCFDDCMQRNQMRAVAVDVIEADCRTECGTTVTVATMADLHRYLPECAAYVATGERFMRCDAAPQDARAAIGQAIDAMVAGWSGAGAWDPSTRAAANDGCRAAQDGLHDSMRAMGCAP